MINIKENISSLDNLLSNETNEDVILVQGKKIIEELRGAWKERKKEFPQHGIGLLNKFSSKLDAISQFIDEVNSYKYIDNSDDADEAIARLYPIMAALEGLPIAARVHKEIRELIERKSSLPARLEKR